jgi:hypothetical protein
MRSTILVKIQRVSIEPQPRVLANQAFNVCLVKSEGGNAHCFQAVDLSDDDLCAMAQIIQAAYLDTTSADLGAWEKNVGRNNLWYSGFQVWARDKLGIVAKCGSSLVKLVSTKSSLSSKGVFDKLRLCHAAGQALYKTPIPRTLQQYKAVALNLKSLLSELSPPGFSKGSSYMIPWIIRSHIFADLRVRGVSEIDLDDTLVTELDGVFPDSGGWLAELAKRHQTESVRGLCGLLGYKHPPELLTMFCCLFGDKDLLNYTPKELRKRMVSLKRRRVEYTKSIGVAPVPVLLVTEVMQSV